MATKPGYLMDGGRVCVEIFFSGQQAAEYFGNVPFFKTWLLDGATKVIGYGGKDGASKVIEARTFAPSHNSRGGVPFKYAEVNHTAALEGYVRAYIREEVTGPPAYLIKLTMDQNTFHRCVERGTIVIQAHMYSVMFVCDITDENYGTLQFEVKANDKVLKQEFYDMFERIKAQKKRAWSDRDLFQSLIQSPEESR